MQIAYSKQKDKSTTLQLSRRNIIRPFCWQFLNIIFSVRFEYRTFPRPRRIRYFQNKCFADAKKFESIQRRSSALQTLGGTDLNLRIWNKDYPVYPHGDGQIDGCWEIASAMQLKQHQPQIDRIFLKLGMITNWFSPFNFECNKLETMMPALCIILAFQKNFEIEMEIFCNQILFLFTTNSFSVHLMAPICATSFGKSDVVLLHYAP